MKKRQIPLIAAALAACALCLVLPLRQSPAADAAPAPAQTVQPAPAADTAPLFPGVDPDASLSMSIHAADRAFEFTRTETRVSVNGHQADSDILETLIEQVTQMPIAPREAFSPGDAPLMTITIASGGTEHTASFYKSPQEEDADVLYTHQHKSYYGVTDAWRVGTLLLTCDGTRIFDAVGNESPAQ